MEVGRGPGMKSLTPEDHALVPPSLTVAVLSAAPPARTLARDGRRPGPSRSPRQGPGTAVPPIGKVIGNQPGFPTEKNPGRERFSARIGKVTGKVTGNPDWHTPFIGSKGVAMSSTTTHEGATGDVEPARSLSVALLDALREAAERSAFRLWCRLLDVSALDLAADPWKERVEPGALAELSEELQLAVLVLEQAYRHLSIAYFDTVGPDGPPDVPAVNR